VKAQKNNGQNKQQYHTQQQDVCASWATHGRLLEQGSQLYYYGQELGSLEE